jgi:hypothetical protein
MALFLAAVLLCAFENGLWRSIFIMGILSQITVLANSMKRESCLYFTLT